MTKRIKNILLATLLSLLLAACIPTGARSIGVFTTDGRGKKVALSAPAQSIVTLSPPITEMLFAIGAGDAVIARDSFSDYPSEALGLPDIGGGFAEYDLETIVSLQPDLVIAGAINTPELIQSLEDLELTVFYLDNPADMEGTFDALRTLGELSGRQTEANTLIINLEARVKAVDDALENNTDRPVVYYELDATDPAAPYTGGSGSFYSAMLRRAGAENVGDALDLEWAQISLETLLLADPDFILLGDAMWGITPESVAERPGWDALSAVKGSRVLPFDDNLIARVGPRQVDGLEALVKIFHPDLFD